MITDYYYYEPKVSTGTWTDSYLVMDATITSTTYIYCDHAKPIDFSDDYWGVFVPTVVGAPEPVPVPVKELLRIPLRIDDEI